MMLSRGQRSRDAAKKESRYERARHTPRGHQNLYAVLTTPVVERDKIVEALPEHLEYQVSLEECGIMFAAGPLFERDGAPPRAGLIIIRANSFAEAEKIAKADPMHARGLRTYALDKWQINEGGFTLKLKFEKRMTTID
jgi:uncharacterized protein